MKGLFAAVATPIHDDGRFDEAGFDRLVEFLVEAGVDGICISGATGEFPHFEMAERLAVIKRAAERLPRDRVLLVGIGSSSMRRTLVLGEAAVAAGSRALLLPMPMFFRYQQEDLQAFAAHVSRALRAPCLLYDLPDFTNGLAPETALALLRDEEFIVGIKDSSGREENVTTFAQARRDRDWTLLVGDDRLLSAGLLAGWDGGISGVAGCCPELLVAIVRSVRDQRPEETARLQARLDELIARLSVFPTPWGIRIALEARGLTTGPLPFPLTPVRRQQIQEFQAWFRGWIGTACYGNASSRSIRDRVRDPGNPGARKPSTLHPGALPSSAEELWISLTAHRSNERITAMRMKTAFLIAPLLGLALTAQQPAPAAPAPPPVPSCTELATALVNLGRNDARMRDWQNLGRYREQNRALAAPAAGESRVVFMGDSITDAWPRRVETFFTGKSYVGRGISGQTTPQMLIRFRPDVVDLKPKVVVILAGTNDIAENTGPMTNEEIQANIMSMTEIGKANGIRVVLSSILPVSAYHTAPNGIAQTIQRPMTRIRAINDWMKKYAATEKLVYLDYFSAMVDATGHLREDLSGDDLHPNNAGYAIMGPLADAAVKTALR